MVRINYCPSCGVKLTEGNFICPNCHLDIEEFFAKGYLLMSNNAENVIELVEESLESDIADNQNININDADEIVIVVPQSDDDEIVIDLDELGIDVENLGEDVNIVIQVEGEDESDDFYEDDDLDEPNEWFFDDDPYGIVYYEFPEEDDE